ncbi:MAG: hypothetical protein LW878_13465 [Proteobacteria bacterium]|nr:hypothetical protein [Pseudomonadota bacterium]
MFYAIILGLLTTTAFAQTCGPVSWVTPAVDSQGLYQGVLRVECTLKKSNPDIRSISAGFKRIALSKAQTIHAGPINETLRGLQGEKFDTTVKEKDGTIRSLQVFASDERDVFIYDNKSQKINLSGLSGYLRKLDVAVEVKRLNSSEIKLVLVNTTHVAKPGLAPAGIFLNMAKKQSLEQFDVALKSLIKDINSL